MALPVPRRALRSLFFFLVLPTLGLTFLIVVVFQGGDADALEGVGQRLDGSATSAKYLGLRSRIGKSAVGAVVDRFSKKVSSSSSRKRKKSQEEADDGAAEAAAKNGRGARQQQQQQQRRPSRPILHDTHEIWDAHTGEKARKAALEAAAAEVIGKRVGADVARKAIGGGGGLDDDDDDDDDGSDAVGGGLRDWLPGVDQQQEQQQYFGKNPSTDKATGHHARPSSELDPTTNSITSRSLLSFDHQLGLDTTLGLAAHKRLPTGLLLVNPQGRHPIYDLIASSHQAWEEKHAKASKTLKQASKEYRRRYGRRPPKGFDKWWDYVQRHNVQLPDEYDQIHHDLEPFFGMSSSHLRSLRPTWESIPGTYVIECDVEGCGLAKTNFDSGNEEEARAGQERAAGQLGLLSEVEQALAAVLEEAGGEESLRVTYFAHDVPFAMAGHEFRSSLEDAASVGEVIDPEEHQHDLAHLGWASACPPHKPLRTRHDPDVLPDPESFISSRSQKKSFVWDHKATMDPCEHPELTQIIGALAAYGKGPVPQDYMYPVLAMCTTKLHADVLTVAMEQFVERIEDDLPWDEKTDDRLLWRGSTTGILIREDMPWSISQRMRLADKAQQQVGEVDVLVAASPTHAVGQPIERRYRELNEQYLDVGFVGQPIQCGSEEACDDVALRYDFKPRQPWSQAAKYKYVFDIDGNGWSARFKRLISTNSCVIKTTIFPEWYQDRIQPWVHYVPVKADLTDLYDVMAFFRGSGEDAKGGHDALAEEIAMEGKKWSHRYWRKEDMVAYLFRLYLEYARILAPNRDRMEYMG